MKAAQLLARGLLSFTGAAQAGTTEEEDHLRQEAAQWGLALAPEENPAAPAPAAAPQRTFYLWPENRQAFELWTALQTQWRIGMEGATGLAYEGVQAELALGRWGHKRHRRRLYSAVKCMERAALEAWATLRAEKRVMQKLGAA